MDFEVLIWLVLTVPGEMLFYYVYSRLLKVRDLLLFWLLWAATLIPLVFCRLYDAPVGLRLVCVFVYQILVPLLLTEDVLPRRILVVVLVNVALMLDELLMGVWLWNILAGGGLSISSLMEHIPAYVFIQGMRFIILAVLSYVIHLLLERTRGVRDDRKLVFLVGFPFAQLLLLFVICALETFAKLDSMMAFNLASAMALLFIAVDALYFVSTGRFVRIQKEEERTMMLQDQVDWCVSQHAEVVDSIEQVARLRHDIRNQVQTIATLTERGEYVQAREHLDELRERLGTTTGRAPPRPLRRQRIPDDVYPGCRPG